MSELDLENVDLTDEGFEEPADAVEMSLEELDLNNNDEAAQIVLSYPCVIMSGVHSQEEYDFFNQAGHRDNTIPGYVEIDGVFVKMMDFDFSIDTLLKLKFLGNYTLTLYRSEDDSVPIDLENPYFLMKFIKL